MYLLMILGQKYEKIQCPSPCPAKKFAPSGDYGLLAGSTDRGFVYQYLNDVYIKKKYLFSFFLIFDKLHGIMVPCFIHLIVFWCPTEIENLFNDISD